MGHKNQPIALITVNLKQVEKLAMRGMNYQQISQALGISDDTLSRRREDQQGVQDAINVGRAKGIAMVSKKIFHGALTGDITASQMRAAEYWMNNIAGWSSNPGEVAGETHNYFVVGTTKSENSEAWVGQYKPKVPSLPEP